MFCAFVNAVLGRIGFPPLFLLNNTAMLKRLHTEPSIIFFVMCEKDFNYGYTSNNQ